ncbi:MAG: hypothetical protein JSV44_08435 [Candidatus Zixiibacteriota bacterium]|nr:MAG: hypothetical protein JSV44_08435 [candidate division Zixibacteria bacterium]
MTKSEKREVKMTVRVSKPNKKAGILALSITIVLVAFFIYLGETYGWSEYIASGEIAAVLAAIISFMHFFVKIQRREVLKGSRRAGVVLNYFSLLVLLFCFYLGKSNGFNLPVVLIGLGALGAIIASFIVVHMRTRLWHLTHAHSDMLDEREIQIAHHSLRFSYGLFTVICLALLIVNEFLREYGAGYGRTPLMPIIGALIYLAHTLPSSVLAWTETEV